jgi:hypothetical protein
MPRFSGEVTAQIVLKYESIDAPSSGDAYSTACALARAALAKDGALLDLVLSDIHIHRLDGPSVAVPADAAISSLVAEIQRLHGEINRLHEEASGGGNADAGT